MKTEQNNPLKPNSFPQIKSKGAKRLQNKDIISKVGLLDKEQFLTYVIYILAFEVASDFPRAERGEKGFQVEGIS